MLMPETDVLEIRAMLKTLQKVCISSEICYMGFYLEFSTQ